MIGNCDPPGPDGRNNTLPARFFSGRTAAFPLQPGLSVSGTEPRMLFFTGGTALKETSRVLARLTRNSVHLVTPFDSGGSSASLRRAFHMPAVGDARARLMALADAGIHGYREIRKLFAHRLPCNVSAAFLRAEVDSLARGAHKLFEGIPETASDVFRNHFTWFARNSGDFCLAGACLGNLLLAAGYLRNNRRLSPVIDFFSGMVRARGLVRPVVEDSAHLAVRLRSGEIIVGQHRFAGKASPPLAAPIASVWLAESEDAPTPARIAIQPEIANLISNADCLCYPVGSFYSSVAANLLPQGVGRAVAKNPGPKVFVPNLGIDPELAGHSVRDQVERLTAIIRADAPGARLSDALTHLLTDPAWDRYPGGIPEDWLRGQGIRVVSQPLVGDSAKSLADPGLLAPALLRLAEVSRNG